MFTKEFWKQTLERFIKTFAQTFIAAGITFSATAGDWQKAGIAAAFAAGLSVLTSIASIGIGDKGTPSLVSATTTSDEVIEVQQQPNVQNYQDRQAISDFLETKGGVNNDSNS